jgi:Contractile injection system tube protein
MTLVKAMLTTTDAGAVAINFQFNPSSLSFSRSVNWKVEPGAYTTAGFPKVSYSNRGAETLKLSNLWFDTYEYATKTSVLTLISPIIKSTEIAGSLKRPPVYIFAWGEQYLKCVVTNISYELTMFLADGTPVRAKVNIDLQEVDDI